MVYLIACLILIQKIEGVDSFEVALHPISSMFKGNMRHEIAAYTDAVNNDDLFILTNNENGNNLYADTVSVSANVKSINLQKLFTTTILRYGRINVEFKKIKRS